MSGGAGVSASVRGCGLPDQQRRHGRGSADQGAAARQEGGQVSCDWWRAGHVTSVLTSDWSGGCRPGDTARRRLAAAGVTGTISTCLIMITNLNYMDQIDCLSIISTLYLYYIYIYIHIISTQVPQGGHPLLRGGAGRQERLQVAGSKYLF